MATGPLGVRGVNRPLAPRAVNRVPCPLRDPLLDYNVQVLQYKESDCKFLPHVSMFKVRKVYVCVDAAKPRPPATAAPPSHPSHDHAERPLGSFSRSCTMDGARSSTSKTSPLGIWPHTAGLDDESQKRAKTARSPPVRKRL